MKMYAYRILRYWLNQYDFYVVFAKSEESATAMMNELLDEKDEITDADFVCERFEIQTEMSFKVGVGNTPYPDWE